MLRIRDGDQVVALEVLVAVNADTHPELAARVRGAGPGLPALTVAGRWVDLAVPLLYHEPSRQLWVLLLPPVLRHRELEERAELLQQLLRAGSAAPIPAYALTPLVVTSAAALEALRAQRATDGAPDGAPDGATGATGSATDGGVMAPPRLPAEASDPQALSAWQRALQVQAEALARRERELVQREAALQDGQRRLDRAQVAPTTASGDAERDARVRRRSERWRDATSSLFSDPEARASALADMVDEPLSDPALLGLVELEMSADEAEPETAGEAPHDPSEGAREASRAAPGPHAADDAPAPAPTAQPAPAPAPPAAAPPVASAAAPDTIDEALSPQPGRAAALPLAADPMTTEQREGAAAVPDPWLIEVMALGRHALAVEGEGGAARVRLGLAAALLDPRALHGALDVRIVLHRAPSYPVIALLIGAPAALRGADRRAVAVICLDLGVDRDRAALATLARSFALVADVFDGERWLRHVELEAPLAANVAYLLRAAKEHLRELAEHGGAASAARACELVLHPDHDVLGAQHPLAEDLRLDQLAQLDTPAQAQQALEVVRRFSEPAGEDYLVCTRGLPLVRWRALRRPVLERATTWGLWMGPNLARVAVSEGLARSRRELVRRLLDGFEQLRQSAAPLDEHLVRDNLAALEAEALALGLRPGQTRPLTIASETDAVVAGTIDLVPADPELALTALSLDELVGALADTVTRFAAAVELCRRGARDAATAIVAALVHLTRAELPQVLAHLLNLGPTAERPLITALSCSKSYVRQGAALALAQLAGEDGITAIIDLLLIEPTEIWKEIARGVGQVGPPAIHSLAHAVAQRGVTARIEERVTWALAHLGARDCHRALGQMSSGHSIMAPMAAKALALVEPAYRDQQALLSEGAESGQDVQRAFSRQFFHAIETAKAGG